MTSADDLTTCDLCGAAVAQEDRHNDWHAEQAKSIDDRIAKALATVRQRLTYNP